ncbi:MAG TPA: hypothetical protein VGM05_03400 [Planctomycetaceae bacterium]|jgi:hypothetical protein
MAVNQWSKRSLVLVVSVCAIGGFLIGSASSQSVRQASQKEREYEEDAPTRAPEAGRYQMVQTSAGTVIFDTRTAHYWQRNNGVEATRWNKHHAPWEKDEK